jgi:uncharacterized protein with ParB-like and HNH nuclease domain
VSYVAKTIGEVVIDYLNRTTFLPAIQREYVWEPEGIERLFDSIMGNYPIGSFLFWKIREEHKNDWTAYRFISEFNREEPHNEIANLAGVNQDIYLVLDGQQRLTSLYIGLKGFYRYFYYSWKKTQLYLNLFKEPTPTDNPEDLTYEFAFRESASPSPKDPRPQYWYPVGDILNFPSTHLARQDIRKRLASERQGRLDNALVLIEELHSRLFTERLVNYYEERDNSYAKVVEIFIRINTGGKKLEYSDILLSLATATWKSQSPNARDAIHEFTDDINAIGGGYSFGKDFVLKGALYLTEGLPIQYKVANFTKSNLERIEQNWEAIKANIETTVRLISKFGFTDKNLISGLALLPIALHLKHIDKKNFATSWIAIILLKNVFGAASDTVLKNVQDVLNEHKDAERFPYEAVNRRLGIESAFADAEIENLLLTAYGSKYSYLILSLLYPDRDWRDNAYHEDHIFPKTAFAAKSLGQHDYAPDVVERYKQHYNTIANLQLLTDKENLEKNASPFDAWLSARDEHFKTRHSIPEMKSYDFDQFLGFIDKRRALIKEKLRSIAM